MTNRSYREQLFQMRQEILESKDEHTLIDFGAALSLSLNMVLAQLLRMASEKTLDTAGKASKFKK